MDAETSRPQASAVPTLGDLVQRHLDRTNATQRSLETKSGIAHQTFSNWRKGAITAFPDAGTIRKFAAATGYSERTVVLAIAASIGLRITEAGPELASMLPPGTEHLIPEDVDAVRAIVRQLIEARRAAGLAPPMESVEGVRLDAESFGDE